MISFVLCLCSMVSVFIVVLMGGVCRFCKNVYSVMFVCISGLFVMMFCMMFVNSYIQLMNSSVSMGIVFGNLCRYVILLCSCVLNCGQWCVQVCRVLVSVWYSSGQLCCSVMCMLIYMSVISVVMISRIVVICMLIVVVSVVDVLNRMLGVMWIGVYMSVEIMLIGQNDWCGSVVQLMMIGIIVCIGVRKCVSMMFFML